MSVSPDEWFSPDFSTSRQRFRHAAAAVGWRLDAHPVTSAGPGGERLSIDAASSSPPAGRRVLVISSGLHGVEGFFGAAVQLALLDRWGATPPVCCVLLHALNPFGFAWLRRTDDRNVDLNRNFLLDHETYTGSPPGYAALDPLLNPRRPPPDVIPFLLKALPVLARRGAAGIRRTVAVGQYEFPCGLFFGGFEASPAAAAIEAALRARLAGAADVVHLDLHTGLGGRGDGRLLIDYTPTGRQRDRLTRWFGAKAFSTPDSSRTAYTARGGLGRWCVSQRPRPAGEYLFAYAEFGTFAGARVLAGLRAENQAHHWGRPLDPGTIRAKAALRELFCPADRAWRSKAIARSLDLISRAADGLAREGHPW